MKNNSYRTSLLLNKLIQIAQIPKTDFALFLNMTPSGLSKILTASRLPSLKEKKNFSRQAGRYFANIIFSAGCYFKFKDIFPFIYDFHSKDELSAFLAAAIEYTLDLDFMNENGENSNYPDKEIFFLGKKNILNMFCIIVSDLLHTNPQSEFEVFSTLPIFDHNFSDIFSRIVCFTEKKQASIVFNHLFDKQTFELAYEKDNINIVSVITEFQNSMDLNFWQLSQKIEKDFILIQSHCLFSFSIQLDGTPLLSYITHRGYLAIFFKYLNGLNAAKMSYSSNEIIQYLEQNSTSISDTFVDNIQAIYNFIPVGYLLTQNELSQSQISKSITNKILQLYEQILNSEHTFFISVDLIQNFCTSGKISLPLVGIIDIPPKKRISYLKRLNRYYNEYGHHRKIKIVNAEMPRVSMLCAKGFNVIYTFDVNNHREKIHCFNTGVIYNIMQKEVNENHMPIFDFTPELWQVYLDEYTALLDDFHVASYIEE